MVQTLAAPLNSTYTLCFTFDLGKMGLQAQRQKFTSANPSPRPTVKLRTERPEFGLLHASNLNTKQIALNVLMFHKTAEMRKKWKEVLTGMVEREKRKGEI